MDEMTGLHTYQQWNGYFHSESNHFRGQPSVNRAHRRKRATPGAINIDGILLMDSPSISMYRGNGVPSPVEVGPHGSSWSRSGESMMVHGHNHLIRGNYLGQHFQPDASPWQDQQLNSNINDSHAIAWNQYLPMAYVQATNVNESSSGNSSMGLLRYHEAAGSRRGLRFPHPPPVNPRHHNFHHLPLAVQGVRGHSINFHPSVAAASYRVPTNPSRSAAIPRQNGFEMGASYVGLAPPAGPRSYRTLGRQHQNLPPIIQVDDVALLVDHHTDMSYEASRQIGNVSTSLTEEMVMNQMKTKTVNLEEAGSEEQEADSCVICQDEYKNGEKIGILRCGHEYHADCLRQWILVKNVCPLCKSQSLTP
ncbi:Zinc finger, RING-type [Sesbania bispinosa]|nr:Zinc finger, RING-type [Sesbania bispinosa]